MRTYYPTSIDPVVIRADYEEQIQDLKEALRRADAIMIGAGSGLSTAAGFTYSGERFEKYFSDFARKYGIKDMYSGGFYPFDTLEEYWAWWSRHIYFNRYITAYNSVYSDLLKLVEGKEYFVLTTNVDHQFQLAGFDKKRLFYTQGDYGLLQSSKPKVMKTYDNRELVEKMIEAQGFVRNEKGIFEVPADVQLKMSIPADLVPYDNEGNPMTTNLRADNTFVEDAGWHEADGRYEAFLAKHGDGHILYLELGVGMNTPVIIKFPFWKMTADNQNAQYACINFNEAVTDRLIADRSITMNADIAKVLRNLLEAE